MTEVTRISSAIVGIVHAVLHLLQVLSYGRRQLDLRQETNLVFTNYSRLVNADVPICYEFTDSYV